jgi:Rieske Fe-S protein
LSTDESRITERLATIYALRVPKDIIASTFTDHPRLPVLPSRASFRDYIYFQTEQRAQMLRERRSLLRRILAVAAFSISALVLIEIGSPLSRPAQSPTAISNPTTQTATTVPNPTTQTAATVSNPTTQTSASLSNQPAQTGRLLTNASSIPSNHALTFDDPKFGPALLIHLDNGQFVAYSAICTHLGCQVYFAREFREISCPCHHAIFDPYHNARVVWGPPRSPLPAIPIQYDPSTGNIYLTS